MTALRRDELPFNDPTDRTDSYATLLTLRQADQAERDRARLKTAEMAIDRDDLTNLLGALGLGDPAEITAHLARRRTP